MKITERLYQQLFKERTTNEGYAILALPVALILVFFIVNLAQRIHDPSFSFLRDLPQDYLMGKAFNDGLNPYQTYSDLMRIYFPGQKHCNQIEYSPHTPFSILLFSSFTFLDIYTFSTVWLLFSVACLLLSTMLLVERKAFPILFVFFAISLTIPGIWDLLWGQVNSLLLFIYSLAIAFLISHKKLISGFLVGIAFHIKMLGWPILLFFLLKKEWRFISGAAISLLSLLMFEIYIFEPAVLKSYLSITAETAQRWINDPASISIPSVIHKSFHPFSKQPHALPCGFVRVVPEYDLLLEILSAVSILISSLFLLKKFKRRNDNVSAFLNLLAFSAIATPLSWPHYVLLLVPKFIYTVREFSNNRTRANFIALSLHIILFTLPITSLCSRSIDVPPGDSIVTISFFYNILSMLPTLTILVLCFM